MDTATELGNAIRQARKHFLLTQTDLAELVGVSDRTVRDIEKGKSGASFATVLAVAHAVGVRLEIVSNA
ncbi:MAG TPA: type II toxin-antitoxin system Y4mF family antitoxin [Candidatus Rothia avistercoris]|uniref:Type II toxin-antitoxin system Y4mF family antitoxin n=1 Tax=Candidatus Rothia avistercoris TaxID=2840479 RepID=A0A9D2UFR8_9MICC|nr:type II toxin-antitoxin system Y4mF family antitoxin [Rothia nasimurium]HJD51602.1 type II toxin-antitoxin system Y4mF family antitoxin [Candidatus Rothia avistercoris]